ncbi:MAG: hypothetical protein WBE20_10590 [Candidatus Acidiferrales bacterium]
MRKYWMLALVAAIPCSAGAQKKPKPLPMPPLVSHEQPMSNYACFYSQASQTSATSYWDVVAFAEYGKGHKRYWSKSLGTFRGSESLTTHNSESAGSGSVVGVMVDEANYGDAGKKCSEWEQAVLDLTKKAQSK